MSSEGYCTAYNVDADGKQWILKYRLIDEIHLSSGILRRTIRILKIERDSAKNTYSLDEFKLVEDEQRTVIGVKMNDGRIVCSVINPQHRFSYGE